MPFTDIFKEVVNGTEGAIGALVIGVDGISVDEYSTGGEIDLQSMSVEYSALLKEIEKGSQAAHLGSTKEGTIISEKAMIMLRRLNDDYFLFLFIMPYPTFFFK